MKTMLAVLMFLGCAGTVCAQAIQVESTTLNAVAEKDLNIYIDENSVVVWWAFGQDTNPTGIAKSFDTGYNLGKLPFAGDWLEAMRLDIPITFDILAGIDAEGGDALVGFGLSGNWGDEHFRLNGGLGLLSTGNLVPYVGFGAHF
jgi:hypothetical protein